MKLKKILVIALIAFVVTVILSGGLLYWFSYRAMADEQAELPVYKYHLGEFSTNLGSQRSFFKGEIVVETSDKRLLAVMDELNVVLRDGVIKTLIGKRPEDVLSPEGKQKLRTELIDVLSEILQSDQITNIYFVDYIVQ